MRPWFEKVVMPPDSSWLLFDRQLPEFPFNWHYHPEFELTLTLNSEGMRFVGDHVASYTDADLVLIGPNLPHAWQSRATIVEGTKHRALVCWFTQSWITTLTAGSPELSAVAALLQDSSRGLAFESTAANVVRTKILSLVEATPAERWLGLLEILLLLSHDRSRTTLASGEITLGDVTRDRERLGRVFEWLNDKYAGPVHLEELARLAHLSKSQLQRLFKRSSRMSVSDYVARLRIGHACALLAQSDLPISRIAEIVGYGEPSYFTRQFRAAKNTSPSAYRQLFRL